MKGLRRVVAIVTVAALAGPGWSVAQVPAGPVTLKDVSVSQRGEGVTVQLRTTASAKYEATVLESPPRLVVDVQGLNAWPKGRMASDAAPIREIRGSQYKPGVARVVIELTRKVGYRIDTAADGLTVVLEPSATAKGAAPAKPVAVAAAVPAAGAPKAEPVKPEAAPATAKAEAPKAVRMAETAAAPSRVTEGIRPVGLAVPAPFQAAPPRPQNGRPISMDFKDADVVNLLRILAAESGRNIVAGPDVKGKVSISLHNVSWEQALDTVLEIGGLRKIEKAGVIRVVSVEQLAKEQDALARVEESKRKAEIDTRTKLAEAQIKEQELASKKLANEAAAEEARARGPLREETVRLQYADPEEVAKTLQGILGIPPEGSVPVATTVLVPTTLPSGPSPSTPTGGGQPYIAEQPFSQAFGPQAGVPRQPAVSVSQDVLAKGITIRPHKATNSIFIRHYQADLERIKKLIREQLDVPMAQVKIEARMEVLDRNALEAIGVQWGGAGAGSVNHATLVGQGYQSAQGSIPGQTLPIQGGVLQADNKTIVAAPIGIRPGQIGGLANPNLSLSQLLPVDTFTGLPTGAGNLVNLPIQALTGGVPAAGGVAFGLIGTNWNLNLALQALATQGKTRTLARPEIVTVENNKAAMSIGEEIPFATISSAGTQIQFKEALLKLEVTPTVIREATPSGSANKIKMIVVVENNSRGQLVNLGTAGSPPAIDRRKAETQVVVKEGERLVIGGVTQDTKSDTIRKVPLLGDIPVLGWFFKQKGTNDTGRELVVFVTPTVLQTDRRAANR